MFSTQPGQSQNSIEPLVILDSGPIVQLCTDCSPRELRLAVTPKQGLRIKKSQTLQEDPEVIEVSFGNLRDASLSSEFVPRWELSGDGSRETSFGSEVKEVGIQPRTSTLGSEIVTGQLVIEIPGRGTPPQPFVAAGQTHELQYDLLGDFPLGVVTGSVRFFAPELADPATLNFEVHSKLTKFYIVIAIALGLILSWYLKVYLHNRIELAEAGDKALTLLDRVQTDWNSHPDHVFRDALTERITTLRAASDGQDPAAIAPEITALDSAWRAALQDFATRVQTSQTALDDLRKATDSVWILPASILAVLASAKQAPAGEVDIPHIQRQIAQNDPAAASNTIVQLRQQLSGELRARGINWHSNVIQYLHGLAEAQAGLPARIVAQFSEILGTSEQGLRRMNPDQLVADPPTAALIQFLRDFEAEYRAVGELLKELGLRLAQERTEFTKTLDISPDDIAANQPLSNLKTKLDSFGNGLDQATSEPQAALNALQQSLTELQQAWREVILQQRDTLPEGSRPNVDALLQHQDFLGAVALIAAAMAAARKNVVLKEDEQEEEESPSWPEFTGLWPPSSLSVVSSSPQVVGIPSAFAGLHLQSLKQVKAATRVQTLVVGILLVVWAYSFYSRTYNGTWSDLSTIFFAAFGLDITLDALSSKIGTKTA